VVSLTQGHEVRQPGAQPEAFAAVGTLATITDFSHPQPGLMTIHAVGMQRFQITSSERLKHGLWVADVERIADDAAEVRSKAQATLVRAGERAEALAAAAEARRYFEQAAGLTDTPSPRAELLARAGYMAANAGQPDAARGLLIESIELYEGEGDTHAAARVMSRLARVDAFTGRRDEAMERMERAFAVTSDDEPDEDLALLAARLALGHWYGGDLERASERTEFALDIAEKHAYPTALALALRAKAGVAVSRGHGQEGDALLAQALRLAVEHDIVQEAGTCYFWLSDRCFHRDAYDEALGYLDEALALTRRVGDRPGEWAVLAERTHPLHLLGRWDEVEATSDEFTQERWESGGLFLSLFEAAIEVNVHRGRLEDAHRIFALLSRLEESTDTQERSAYLATRAALRRAEGQWREALDDGEAAIEAGRVFGIAAQSAKLGLVEALEAARSLGEREKVDELLTLIEAVPPGTRPPYLDAQAIRFRALLGDNEAGLGAATERFRTIGIPFWVAVTQLEHGELLVGKGRADDAAQPLEEARETFERLGAAPWLARLAVVAGTPRVGVTA